MRTKNEVLFDVERWGWLDSDLVRLKTGGVILDASAWQAGADGRKIVPAGTPVGKLANGKYGPAKKAELVTGTVAEKTAIKWVAKKTGAMGNNITVAFVVPNQASASLSVSVSGTAITVSLATDADKNPTSTAAQVVNAVKAHQGASALVDVSLYGDHDGSGVLGAMTATNLAGGVSAEFLTFTDCDLTDGDDFCPVMDWGRVITSALPVAIDEGHKETLTGITWVG